ncbi:hypothetical protein BLOT_006029 [Blomia tropicalis]|nr:hypothetical protein BLOT_006029 [Blomia tropicalis]
MAMVTFDLHIGMDLHGEQISLASNRRHQRTHTKEVEVGGKMFQLKRFELDEQDYSQKNEMQR